jgi:AcrR family transcriptional regulator
VAKRNLVSVGEEPPRRDTRPVGRPRIEGTSGAASPRDEIIAAATHLFAEKGYGQTTMSDISRAVGLQQSSLYYWFRRKEMILGAVLTVNRAPLEFIGRVGAGSGAPSLKLYRLLRFDTRQLCLSPVDFNEIERLTENQPEDFADFWRDYTRLHEWVASLVRAGVDEGEFIDCDAEVTAIGLLCLNEGVQKRFRYQDRHDPVGDSPFRHTARTADGWAEVVATTSLRSLLRRPDDVVELRRLAATYDDS